MMMTSRQKIKKMLLYLSIASLYLFLFPAYAGLSELNYTPIKPFHNVVPSQSLNEVELNDKDYIKNIDYNSMTIKKIMVRDCKVRKNFSINYSQVFSFSISTANIYGVLYGQLSNFSGLFSIRFATLNNGISLYNSSFNNQLYYYGNSCLGQCDFSFISANKVYVGNSNFSHVAEFSNANFRGKIEISDSDFFKGASFSSATFYNTLSIKRSIFTGTLNFHAATFENSTEFSNIKLNGSLDFSDTVKIKQPINLRGTVTPLYKKKKIQLNLVGSNVDQIKFDYQNFTLYFPPHTTDADKTVVYEKSLHQFIQDGLLESYKILFIEYKKWLYTSKGQYILNAIDKLWWNYGIDNGRVLVWIMAFIGFLTLINAFYYDYFCNALGELHFLIPRDNIAFLKEHNPLLYYINGIPKSFLLTIYLCFGGTMRVFWAGRIKTKANSLLFYCYLVALLLFGSVAVLFIFQWAVSGVVQGGGKVA